MTKARWYVVHVYSGFEKKVVEAIKSQAEKEGLTSQIEDFLVPTEQVSSVKKGVKISTEKNFLPGYILVKMVMSDVTWHIVRNTDKVTNFLGGKGKPSPVPESQVLQIQQHVEERQKQPSKSMMFDLGEQVRVCDGPFSTFSGVVEGIDYEKERLKVSVMIFGRPTPVDLEYTQVEKV